MSMPLASVFSEMDAILGICPCCGDVFRLSDVRPHLRKRKPVSIFDKLETEERKIDSAEERLEQREAGLREKSRAKGQRAAKARLRKIDPVFSGRGLDPQDVKVIFDPVEYVVFDGANEGSLRAVRLMAHPPVSKGQETVHKSLAGAIGKGNLEFITMRITDEGKVETE